jgi:alpha-tubulin suppressor-like RCC1 family protein
VNYVDEDVLVENIDKISGDIKKKKAYIWSFGKNGDGELGVGS